MRVEVPVPRSHTLKGQLMDEYVMFIFSPFPPFSLFIHPLPSFFRRKRCPAFPKGGFIAPSDCQHPQLLAFFRVQGEEV